MRMIIDILACKGIPTLKNFLLSSWIGMQVKSLIKLLIVCLLGISFAFNVQASNSTNFVVQDIEINGLQRISLGTVLNYLPIEVGQSIKPTDTATIIRALYKTGFFKTVTLQRKGNVLVINVQERPTIGSIQFNGNKEVPTEALMESLKSVNVAEGRVYDPSVWDGVKESLQNEYYNRGNYNAKVTITTVNQSQNRVGVIVDIKEGKVAKIKSIKFIGNHAFTEKQLIKQMEITTPNLLTRFTKTDQYSREKLDADLEKINTFYQDQGYIQFKIESTQVSMSPTRDEIYIVIRIFEGPQFVFKGYEITGEMVVPKADLEKLVQIKSGEIFSRTIVNQTTRNIGNYLANFGYSFASVRPIPEIDEESKQVFVTFVIEPGEIIYVRRINFYGNTKTQDEVLRRVMRQEEGAVSSLEKLRLSERKLNFLGYFKTVKVDTKSVPGTDDQVDVDVTVVEQASASLSMSVGYSDTEKLLINAGFNQPNFMGTGSTFGINIGSTAFVKSGAIEYFNPYYTEDGVGRGFSLYATKTDYDDSDVTSYTADQFGGSVYYSVPLSEKNNFTFGYGYQLTNLLIPNQAPQSEREAAANTLEILQKKQASGQILTIDELEDQVYALYILTKGASPELIHFKEKHGTRFRNLLLTSGWSYADFDRAFYPTRGFANYLDAMLAVKASAKSLNYYKVNYSAHYYQPLLWDFIFTWRGEIGYGGGLQSSDELPFYENYYAGGIGVRGAIRGFEGYSVGPKTARGDNLGGNFLVDNSIGLIVPIPYVPDTFRTTLFLDSGNVYPDMDPISDPLLDPFLANPCSRGAGPMRFSAGIQVEWRSPMGPLVLSLARPLNSQHCDREDPLQFSVGTSF